MIICGNWKSHKTIAEAQAFVEKMPSSAWLAVPATTLSSLREAPAKIGAQDLSPYPEGAYTGALTAEMLKDAGAQFVLVGHSERRHVFGESNSDALKKLKRAQEVGLQPIFCVGEKPGEEACDVIAAQLEGVSGDVVIAYEPVWAIGTGAVATPEVADKTHAFIKSLIDVPVLYGGSVKPENARELASMPHIDGLLIGAASLDARTFTKILEITT